MKLIVHFEETHDGLVSKVGGKGANLIALTAAGFPVPGGFVVTADAYVLFLETVPWLESELGHLDFADPHRLHGQCEALQARLKQVSMPNPVQDAIHLALDKIGIDEAYAVRSSSTFEDLSNAAFAGQHDTFLNVRGVSQIVEKTRDCFVSLWGDRAVLYRQRQGYSQKETRMAVVVQRQIACDVAGVGFSIHPVTGQLDRMTIDANFGLGESVVAGECEIDHFELDKSTLLVAAQTLGRKDRMLLATDSGVVEKHVPETKMNGPCVNAEQLSAVGQLLKKVEAHYSWPQDIEWGWHGERLFLFQARPVTTIPPRWTRDESAERFPRPMSPLSWDFLSVAFRRSMTHSLALMGLPPLQGDWFAWFDHYVYGNQNAVQLIGMHRPIKARNAAELVKEIPELRRRFNWVLELPILWARDLDRYLIRLGQLQNVALAQADLPKVWRHMELLLAVASEYFLPNIAISMTQAFLHRTLHALVAMVVGPEKALAVVDGLLAGCDTKTAVVNRELHGLAQTAASLPALKQLLLEQTSQETLRQGKLTAFPEFAAKLQRFLEDHGHREMDMDYLHPTWSDQPSIVLDAVALILRAGVTEEPGETARKLRISYARTEHQFLGSLPEELQFFFREIIRLARTYTSLDDMEHYQTTRVNPLARRGALHLGCCLQERGILVTPGDVFFLRRSDVEELLTAYPDEDRDLYRRRAQEGKKSYEASLARSPAWALADDAPSAPEEGQTLRGLAGSPGRVTGPCFRIFVPEDFARFPKNAILVARTTNPAWTPLFYSAAGLITESGGPLSHGAVTAREMTLPAVMSVRNAMTLLRDGQVVTVDGTQGLVRVQV
jgi:phosphohistidine swiveling domain-containing protein